MPINLLTLTAAVFLSLAAATANAQAPGPAPAAGEAAAEAVANSDIETRLERIEEQIIDLQSQAATLESLAKSAGGGGAPSFGGPAEAQSAAPGEDASRISGLEVQLQALTAQMGDILQRLQQIEAGQGIAPVRRSGSLGGAVSPQTGEQPVYAGTNRGANAVSAPVNEGPPAGFGSVTIEPRPGEQRTGAIGDERRYAGGGQALPPPGGGDAVTGGNPSAQPARFSTAEARTLYDQAYSSLVKREYKAAETYFTQFLQLHPNDALAAPAQFWLGETAFVSGEYRQAADMFLKAYTSYPSSDKAPEALLKLGISLKRLGENNAACDTFVELAQKFPQAQSVLQRAEAEKRRSKC